MMKIGLGITELWVDKLGWGQIPFSRYADITITDIIKYYYNYYSCKY